MIADGNHAAGWAGAIPLDVRNATRTTDASEQNRQGLGVGEDGDPSPTLTNLFTPAVLTYDTRGNGDGQVVNTMAGDHQNRVTDYTALVLQRGTEQQAMVLRNREGKPGGGKGPLLSAERSLTLGTSNDQVVFPTLNMGAHTAAPGSNGQDAIPIHTAMAQAGVGIPRRLTPLECEKLMSWPPMHTAFGIDEQGREYALSDTARYKLCGNGCLSACVAWIGFRLRDALDTPPERA